MFRIGVERTFSSIFFVFVSGTRDIAFDCIGCILFIFYLVNFRRDYFGRNKKEGESKRMVFL